VGKKIGLPVASAGDAGSVPADFGFLTNRMEYRTAAAITIAGNMIQPRPRAKLLSTKSDLVVRDHEQDVLDATATIMPCFEIVDSRIRQRRIKIQDTVADNASCGVMYWVKRSRPRISTCPI